MAAITFGSSLTTRPADGSADGLLLSGATISHQAAQGSDSTSFSLNLATGALACGELSLNGSTVEATAEELNLLDGAAAGTVVSSKAVVYGENGEIDTTELKLNSLAVTAAAGELNLLDGAEVGTVVNNKVVVYNGSGQIVGTLATPAQSNITSLGVQAAHLDMGTSFKVVNLDAPTSSADATTKAYVDDAIANAVEGLDHKQEVRVASTEPVTLGTLADGSVMDGVTLSTGDTVLLKDQISKIENGGFIIGASGPPLRVTDMGVGSSARGAAFQVLEGSTNALRGFVCNNASGSDIVGTDALNFVLFRDAPMTAGSGIHINGSTLSVDIASEANLDDVPDVDDELLLNDADAGVNKAVKVSNLSAAAFAAVRGDASIASDGTLSLASGTVTNTTLSVQDLGSNGVNDHMNLQTGYNLTDAYDGVSTIVELNANQSTNSDKILYLPNIPFKGAVLHLHVKNAGSHNITIAGPSDSNQGMQGTPVAQPASTNMSYTFVAQDTGSWTYFPPGVTSLLAGNGLDLIEQSLRVNVDDLSLEINGDGNLQIKASGVTNAMLAGSIADSKLDTISTAGKVAGSAVQLAATTALEDSSGLRVADTLAGDGLGFADQVMSVNVDDSSLEINGDGNLQIKASGVTNAMLNGSIADSKLDTISTAGKVEGSAVQLAATTALEDSSGLRVADTLAGDGLGFADQIMSVSVDDSSLEINGDGNLQIKASGVTNAMLAGSIADSKLDTISTAGKVAGGAVNVDDMIPFSGSLADSDLFLVYEDATAQNEALSFSHLVSSMNNHSNLTSLSSLSGTGTLTSGSIGNGFGSINIGGSGVTAGSLTLDPSSTSGGAITVTNSTTQSSGSLVSVVGASGQTAIEVSEGNVVVSNTLTAGTVQADNVPSLSSGAGSPGSSPSAAGDMYVDTTAKLLYVAHNTSAWSVVGRDAYKRRVVSATTDDITADDDLVAVTSTQTQATTLTLPAVSTLSSRGSMKTVTIVDEGGGAGTHAITVEPAEGDTVNGNGGGININGGYERVTLYCVAPSSWFILSR